MKKDGQCDLWGIMYVLVAFFKRKKAHWEGWGQEKTQVGGSAEWSELSQ